MAIPFYKNSFEKHILKTVFNNWFKQARIYFINYLPQHPAISPSISEMQLQKLLSGKPLGYFEERKRNTKFFKHYENLQTDLAASMPDL